MYQLPAPPQNSLYHHRRLTAGMRSAVKRSSFDGSIQQPIGTLGLPSSSTPRLVPIAETRSGKGCAPPVHDPCERFERFELFERFDLRANEGSSGQERNHLPPLSAVRGTRHPSPVSLTEHTGSGIGVGDCRLTRFWTHPSLVAGCASKFCGARSNCLRGRAAPGRPEGKGTVWRGSRLRRDAGDYRRSSLKIRTRSSNAKI